MNVVFLSPHFPPTIGTFCVRLREVGATVLGIADAPYDALSAELRGALTEYYEGLRGKVRFDRFELLNPLIQIGAKL